MKSNFCSSVGVWSLALLSSVLLQSCATSNNACQPIWPGAPFAGQWFGCCSLHNRAYLFHFYENGRGRMWSVERMWSVYGNRSVTVQDFQFDQVARGNVVYRCAPGTVDDPLASLTVRPEWCGLRIGGVAASRRWEESVYVDDLSMCTNALALLLDAAR